jgi:hypothetical protein
MGQAWVPGSGRGALELEVGLQELQELQELQLSLRHLSLTSHHPQGSLPSSWARMQEHQHETGVLSVLRQ